jgi:hypothetical protein
VLWASPADTPERQRRENRRGGERAGEQDRASGARGLFILNFSSFKILA